MGQVWAIMIKIFTVLSQIMIRFDEVFLFESTGGYIKTAATVGNNNLALIHASHAVSILIWLQNKAFLVLG